MKFRTEIQIPPSDFKIHHKHKMLSIGSCFSENIGGLLKEQLFSIDINPFGIVFNPSSIHKQLNAGFFNNPSLFQPEHLIQNNQVYYSLDFHSKFYSDSKEKWEEKLHQTVSNFHHQIKNIDVLFITFGTAWVYRFLETNEIISNCQKQAVTFFNKEISDLNDTVNKFKTFLKHLINQNKNLKIIITVSPVRHIKDGFSENTQSKSILHVLSHELAGFFKENVIYFPAYEMMMDDLRDYRFYESDLLHPNEQAVSYVYEKFKDTFFDEKTKLIIDKNRQLQNLKNHDFIQKNVEALKVQTDKIDKLQKELDELIK